MRKQRLISIVTLLLVAVVLPACSDAAAKNDFNCPKDPQGAIEQKQASIEDLESEIEGQSGGKVRDKEDEIKALKAEISNLKSCDKAPAKSTTTTTTSTTTAPPITADQLATELADVFQGYDQATELAIGSDNVNWEAPEERGAAAFSEETIKTVEQLSEKLNSSEPQWVAARQRVIDGIHNAGYGDEEVARALSGEGYFAVQTKVASQILGTTYFKDGQVLVAGGWREVGPDDIFWVFLSSDGKIVKEASVRADCANPEVQIVRPVRPDTPEAPPVEIPPGEVCPFNPDLPVDSPFCLKPKNQAENIDRNPALPPQIGGPGTTPVGGDPGPPERPHDTPSGCQGPCPTTPPAAAPTPPSGGGTPPSTVPGCGKEGQPPCSNTGVGPPTTQAPAPAPPVTSSPTVPAPEV